jgi:hypothetical protein
MRIPRALMAFLSASVLVSLADARAQGPDPAAVIDPVPQDKSPEVMPADLCGGGSDVATRSVR